MDVDDMDRVSVSRSKRLIDQNRPASRCNCKPFRFLKSEKFHSGSNVTFTT